MKVVTTSQNVSKLGLWGFLALGIEFSACLCAFYDEVRRQSQDRPRPLLPFGALGILKMREISQSAYLCSVN